ncbi:Conserved hypothetical protein [Prochlorococcus marinus str. MIT 9313]|uniref:Uncharacterized protein n=1 Tax=Prochlorococcus marinus (strain MIT 9313) TaxID=74547 RepID=B9ERB9_PROMM|nr:Conserved hypothetical protein [Prochlorococcus marinus str. MIT 9313]
MNLPVTVALNRLAAALRVLSLGISDGLRTNDNHTIKTCQKPNFA